MDKWSVNDVTDMLDKQGMGSYVGAFKARKVDGKMLCSFQAEDLAKVRNAASHSALCARVHG